MLLTLAAWLYISLLAFAWGAVFTQITDPGSNSSNKNEHFAITCFTGLALIGILIQWISLWSGLDRVWIQLLLLAPPVYYYLWKRRGIVIWARLRKRREGFNSLTTILAALTLLMVLLVSVYEISHPDTLAYHEQLIKWAEHYRAVPGIVHLDYHYAFQSSWFLLSALFSFSFFGTNALSFVNSTVLFWLVMFLCSRVNQSWRKSGKPYQAIGWFLFFALCTGIYQFVLLTASSASPDFPAAIFILLPFYHSLRDESKTDWPVIILLCFFAMTVKLSTAPVLLLVFAGIGKLKWRKLAVVAAGIFLIIIPFLLRNYISSGHLLFPVSLGSGYLHADWTYDAGKMKEIGRYILAFARMHTDESQTSTSLLVPTSKWIPVWWHERSLPNKILLLLQPLAMLMLFLNLARIKDASRAQWICLLVALAGLIFWFLKGPDPRFGAGFLLAFPALVYSMIREGKQLTTITAKLYTPLLFLGCLTVGLYAAFRLSRYFKKEEWLAPEGIVVPRTYYYYDAIKASIPLSDKGNKNITILPADSSAPQNFEFRGANITDGFRARSGLNTHESQ